MPHTAYMHCALGDANKPKPPPRAELVAAWPLAFGFALLRRACIETEQAVTLLIIGFLGSMSKLCATQQASSLLPNAGSLHRDEPASSRCGRALAAKGRTAHANATTNFVALAPACVGFTAGDVQAFECQRLKAR